MSGDVAVLGVGMHPWGKWGRNFVEYGVHAARAALKDAGVRWRDIQFVSGAATMRCGYPGYVAGATFAQALGWQGAEVNTSYAACASGSQALAAARAKILAGGCDVALVVGADTTPKGFLAPAKGYRPDDPDWVRFHIGITNPTYFALYARRRMALYGATENDFAAIKVKNAAAGATNPNARYRKKFTAEEVLGSAMVADPLRLFQICATSDGGAAIVISSLEYARKLGVKQPGAHRRDLDRDAAVCEQRGRDAGHRHGFRRGRATAFVSRVGRAQGLRRGGARPRRTCRSPRSTTSRRRWSSTGTSTSASANRAAPKHCCAAARPRSVAASP